MKEMLLKLLSLFRPMSRMYGDEEAEWRAMGRNFVMTRSRGNLNLQLGRYLDADDYATVRRQVLHHDFGTF